MTRVVVVDDHAVVRSGLAGLMAATDDLECVGDAANGADALELVARVDPDVVVLDLSMPTMDGIALTRALRRSGQDVRILILTSFGDAERVIDALRAGADGYLLKECEAEEILAGVRAVAAGRAPLDPTVARELISNVRESPSGILSDRERQVLEMMRTGHPNKSIARRLQISERTVKAHVTHIFQRIGVSDRTQAALWAERHLPADHPPWSAA
ncbi:MAG: two component transcriptional regulator, LuxR family [Blastococcus sp.]|nr:two component transcriptional regulator, LuxR family [Blastococcus sp.]